MYIFNFLFYLSYYLISVKLKSTICLEVLWLSLREVGHIVWHHSYMQGKAVVGLLPSFGSAIILNLGPNLGIPVFRLYTGDWN